MSLFDSALPETRLEIDLMILDYLLFMGVRALLQEQTVLLRDGVEETFSQQPLRMVDAFLPIFKSNHPTAMVPESIRFRLRLIKFATLYSKRKVPCETTPPIDVLAELRSKHQERAEEFYDSGSESSFQDSLFDEETHSSRRPASRSDSSEDVSLADLVPLFIGMSAAVSTAVGGVNQTWMELAGEFMLQAALEQCLEYSNCSGAKLREIFSWGWRSTPTKCWEDEDAVNDMFYDEDTQQEICGWAAVRRKFMDLMRPKTKTNLAKQLKSLTRRFSLNRFEESVLHFLEAMQSSQPQPLLVQLETGKVSGMSEDEVSDLKSRLRLTF